MAITMSAGTTSSSLTQNTVFAGYLCSHCRNPVVEIINIQSKAQGRTSGLGKVSEEELAQRSASNIKKAVDALLSYFQNPTAKTFPRNTANDISYLGWNIPCPVCGKMESWQDLTLLRTQPVFSEISVFPNLDSAYEWARSFLENRKSETDRILSSSEELDNLHRLEEKVIAVQKSLQAELESGEAVQQVVMLQNKLEQISKELKAQGLFSKERKHIQAELNSCEEEKKDAENKLKTERKQLEAEIMKAEIRRKDYQLLQTHYADRGVLIKKEESIALRLQERDEENASGYTVSLQQLPKLVSVQISPFEKNKDLLSHVLVSSLLENISEKTTSQPEEGNQ